VFHVPEDSVTLCVLDTQQPHPVNFPVQVSVKVSVTYLNKGNYEEINMDSLAGYA
jgi:hypothetical protein